MSVPAAICRFAWFGALVWSLVQANASRAELPVDVEVAMEAGVPITAPQEWAKILGRMDIGSVRLRSVRVGDQPEIVGSTNGAPERYKVVALLNRSGELVLPERRYRMSDRNALRVFFQDLSKQESFGQERGRFGLTEKQFQTVYEELSREIDFSTKALTPRELLIQLERKLSLPVVHAAPADLELRDADSLGTELKGITAGTALAFVLRREGLTLRPEKPGGGSLQLKIEPTRRGRETWPVGWKTETSPRQLVPQLYEFLTIEIDGYTLSAALDAIKPRLGTRLFFDQWILARSEIDPDQVQVKLPKRKTFLKNAVDKMLSQARLAGELRVDERGHSFYWITQFGKDSPRAE